MHSLRTVRHQERLDGVGRQSVFQWVLAHERDHHVYMASRRVTASNSWTEMAKGMIWHRARAEYVGQYSLLASAGQDLPRRSRFAIQPHLKPGFPAPIVTAA